MTEVNMRCTETEIRYANRKLNQALERMLGLFVEADCGSVKERALRRIRNQPFYSNDTCYIKFRRPVPYMLSTEIGG